MLRIAVPKGRLLGEISELFLRAGVLPSPIEESRKLLNKIDNFMFLMAKPFDIATYVEQGVADLGIVGLDVIEEEPKDVYEPLDLRNVGRCKMIVASKPDKVEDYRMLHFTMIATKYVNVAKRFFKKKDVSVKIIKLSGSVEIAPIIGLSDYIVDITQTGKTLKENGLVIVEEIFESYAKVVCNKASFKTKKYDILKLLNILADKV